MIALNRLRNPSAIFVSLAQSEKGSDIGKNQYADNDDIATQNLLEKAVQFFSANSREDHVTWSPPMSRVDFGSITQSKFDQIMAKYESMSANKDRTVGIHSINNISKSLLESSIPCDDSCSYPSSRLNKLHSPQVQLPAPPQEYGFSKNPNSVSKSTNLQKSPPKSHFREWPQILDPSAMLELQLQPSLSSEPNKAFSLCIRQGRSFKSDAISGLSMITGDTTVGSVSISTENSAVIESHVQTLVNNIDEVENARSMKKESEATLKDKVKLWHE